MMDATDPRSVPDVRNLSEEEKVQLGIYHTSDHDLARQHLVRLCGKVREKQDALIRRAIAGRRVLDVGSGYGNLSSHLVGHGFDVIPLEPHAETRELARNWFGVESRGEDIYSVQAEPGTIDTVIFRESVEHLDFELALARVIELEARRVIVFQSNLNWLLKWARGRIGHEEFRPLPFAYYRDTLRQSGFAIARVVYRDVVAFPLSGGFVAKQRVPPHDGLERLTVAVDEGVATVVNALGLGPYLCWRYLLVADNTKVAPLGAERR